MSGARRSCALPGLYTDGRSSTHFSFILGVVSIYPAILLIFIEEYIFGLRPLGQPLPDAIYFVFGVGLREELIRLAPDVACVRIRLIHPRGQQIPPHAVSSRCIMSASTSRDAQTDRSLRAVLLLALPAALRGALAAMG